MTIKVEQETLLRVLESQRSYSTLASASALPSGSTSNSDDFLVVDYRKAISSDDFHVEKIRHSTSDDEDSVVTYSTASLSDLDSEDCERRVTFAPELVTDVWTRPYTPKEEIASLYYSTEETQRFRHEYRLERKLLNELLIDPDSFPIDSTEELTSLAASTCRHRISRVVVLHNDKLETFFDDPCQEAKTDFFDNDSFWSGSITWY